MDSKLLEYFLRIAELGSINKAASDLHLSQPALSRHVASLEHEMGTKLFNRTQGGVHLTDAGTLLADRARPLLRQFTILKEQVGEKAAGQIAIGIPTSWQHVFTSPFVEHMVKQYPNVTLRVYEGVSNALRDYMFAGLLDLCIVPFDTSPAAGYRQTALLREPLVLVGAKVDGMLPDEPAPLSMLDGIKLVLPARPNVLRAHVEHSMMRKGMSFQLAVETDTLTLCLDLARRGIGFTVVPACSLYGSGMADSISWAPIRGLYLTWALCENQARNHSQAVREGRRHVISTCAEALAGEIWFGAEPVGTALTKATASKA
ncbi:LysR family transcriptional regulator [Variovorax sp. efr-133-TYG-130]|uniref:LysR family transcriptional regulator n=1 Tax=Variovorax sp. efr-133-TYG-130 TaxID=3040327 RepID=UPI002552FBCA|nr:LysR family transcriptional regulator [Variovorax sp. efr-133-TYG-130]